MANLDYIFLKINTNRLEIFINKIQVVSMLFNFKVEINGEKLLINDENGKFFSYECLDISTKEKASNTFQRLEKLLEEMQK